MEIGASLSPNSESAHWPQHCVVVSVKPTSTTLGNGGVPGVGIQTCLGQAGRANSTSGPCALVSFHGWC
jgi:hypothetical protein